MIDPVLKEQLIAEGGAKIADLIRQEREVLNPERQLHINMLDRNQRFWKGQHYAYPTLSANGVEWRNSAGNMMSEREKRRRGVFDYVLNYYYGDGLTLVGVLGRVPNAIAESIHPDDLYVKRSEIVNRIIESLSSHWQSELEQSEIVYTLYTCSTVFLYTPYVVSRRKYGTTKVPRYAEKPVQVSEGGFRCEACGSPVSESDAVANQMACPACMAPLNEANYIPPQTEMFPVQDGEDEFQNGSVEFYRYDSYTVSTPFVSKFEDVPHLTLEYEEFPGVLLSAYPQIIPRRKQFESDMGSAGNSTQDREARDRRTSISDIARQENRTRRWRYTRTWLKPSMYPMFLDEKFGAGLAQAYPDGLKVTLIQGRVVDLEEEDLHAVWAAIKPTVGGGLYPQPLGNPYIRANELINDGFNIMAKTAMKGIPFHFYNPSMINPKMFKNGADVMDSYPVLPNAAGDIQHAFHTPKTSELQPSVVQMMTTAVGASREIVGVTDPLTGRSQVQQTLGEAELKRNQALLPHNTVWNNIRHGWGDAYRNAVVQFAKNSAGKIFFRGSIPGVPEEMEFEQGDLEDVLRGGWFIEVEESIPMTWGQERAQTWQLIEGGPPVWELMGLTQPNNIAAMQKALGQAHLEIPLLKARQKALTLIRLLLQQQPIVLNGQILPSIPADEIEDDHLFVIRCFQEWSWEYGLKAKDQNRAGYANVLAWVKQHLMMANASAAPAPGGPGQPAGESNEMESQPAAPNTGPLAAPAPGSQPLQNPLLRMPAVPGAKPEEQPVLEGV